MQLLDLTPAELTFLASERGAATDFQRRMSERLGFALTARLRMDTKVRPDAVSADAATHATPAWQPDAALATVWLTRRLGGRHVLGQVSYVPRSLIDMLDETLAECWLEGQVQHALPGTCVWGVAAGAMEAKLALHLPEQGYDMTRWARGVIQRV